MIGYHVTISHIFLWVWNERGIIVETELGRNLAGLSERG